MNGESTMFVLRPTGSPEPELPLRELRFGQQVAAEHPAVVGEGVPVRQRAVADGNLVDRETEGRPARLRPRVV